ncbi:MAG TPA: DUF4179 domain-containing protein [Pseudobacteroides sp.]|uniref:DUF4179 domain-containing protein n=1 Tax=Pseudobacteroides sp. TaxID=1968840 RepID=UPI002F93CF83
MDCAKFKQYIIDYLEGTLDSNIKNEFEEHMNQCIICKTELTSHKKVIDNVLEVAAVERKGILAPQKLDSLLSDCLKNQKAPKRVKFPKKTILIASVIFSIILLAYTPLSATIKDSVIELYQFALGNKAITNSLETGLGQKIDKTSIYKNINFTVHSVINSENKLLTLFSVKYNSKSDLDNINIYGLKLKNQFGGKIEYEYTKSNKFDKNNNRILGNIEVNKRGFFDNTFYLSFDEVNITKSYFDEVSPLLLENYKYTNLKFPQNNQFIKNVEIKNVIKDDKNVTLEYTVEYADTKILDFGSVLFLKKNTGEFLTKKYTQSTLLQDKIVKITDVFTIENLNIGNILLYIRLNNLVENIKGNWQISFSPDKSLTKFVPLVKELKKTFEIEGYRYNLKELYLSPTQANLKIKDLNNELFENLINDMTLISDKGTANLRKVSNEYTLSDINSTNQTNIQDNTNVYEFDPLLGAGNVKLVINSIKLNENTNIQIKLKDFKGKKNNIIDIEGTKYEVQIKTSTNDTIAIYFKPLNESSIQLGSIYLVGSNSDINIFPDYTDSSYSFKHNPKGYNIYHFNINSDDLDKTILVKSIIKYKKINKEILLD